MYVVVAEWLWCEMYVVVAGGGDVECMLLMLLRLGGCGV